MVSMFLRAVSGEGTAWIVLAIYLTLCSTAITNLCLHIFFVLKRGGGHWLSIFCACLSSFTLALFLYPISVSAETDYLTVGLLALFANFGLILLNCSLWKIRDLEGVSGKTRLLDVFLPVFSALLACGLRMFS